MMQVPEPPAGDVILYSFDGDIYARIWGEDNGVLWEDFCVERTVIGIAPRAAFKLPTPVEPPVDSVVIDSDNDAWQHHSDGQWHNTWKGPGRSWEHLHDTYGPLVVVHHAEKKS